MYHAWFSFLFTNLLTYLCPLVFHLISTKVFRAVQEIFNLRVWRAGAIGFFFFSFSFSSPIYRHGSEPLRALSTERKWADTTLVFCLVFFDRLFAAFEQQHVAMEREKDWNRRPQIQLLSDLDSMHPNIHLPNRFSLLNRHHLYAL